jgi:hypothetical protein
LTSLIIDNITFPVAKWYEESTEVAFKIYGKCLDESLPNFLRLNDYYYIDFDEISYSYEIDKDTELYLDKLGEKQNFIESLGNIEYQDRFQSLRASLIYTIISFLYFKDELKQIVKYGEIKPLSLYVYFISAIKNLGDAVDFTKNIEDLILNSRNRLKKEQNHNRELKKIFINNLEYTREYRNYLSHKYFAEFFEDKSVLVYPLEVIKNRNIRSIDHHVAATMFAEKKPADEFIEELFNKVTKGIDLKSEYLIEKCLLKHA